jgi:hypothetical protein
MLNFVTAAVLFYLAAFLMVWIGLRWTMTDRVPNFVWFIWFGIQLTFMFMGLRSDGSLTFETGALVGSVILLLQQKSKERSSSL